MNRRPAMIVALALPFLLAVSARAGGEPVRFEQISPNDYRNFLANWDDEAEPVFRAVIRTAEEYDAIFHPAPVMGDRKPHKPAPQLFENEMIVVVARVVDAPAEGEHVLAVETLSADGDTLELRYRFTPPRMPASFRMKQMLAVRFPRRDLKVVRIVENGTAVGDLRPGEGHWVVPARPAR
jgi:hypothetical protein